MTTTELAVRRLSGLRAGLQIEAVSSLADRRRVAYWRYLRPGEEHVVGAVSRRPDGWRALGYAPPPGKPPHGNVELGVHPDRAAAEAALRRYADEASKP